ncbi:MAG: TolC family protein [Bacteroidota bacterium]|nr:TolC family protein [Bacteroidota bacterium]
MRIRIIPFGMLFLFFGSVAFAQTPVTLQQALALSRKNNAFYQAEKQSVDIAQADVTTAQLKPNPSVSVGVQQLTSSKYFPENTGFFSSANRQVSYQVSKPFQVAGQRKYKIQQAQAGVTLAQTNLFDFERNMLGEAAGQWLDVWYAAKKAEIIQKAGINSDTLVKVSRIRLKDQAITTTEFSRTQIMDSQYKLMLLSARQDFKSQWENLQYLLGTHDSLRIDDEGLSLLPLPKSVDSLLNYAMHNRTDLLVCQQTIEKSKVEIMLQQALAKPQPEVAVGYSRQNQVPYWGVSVSVPLTVYDRNQGEIAKAKVTAQQAESTAQATILKIKSEVKIAFNEYMTNKATFEKYHDIYAQSESVLKTVKFSYLRGGTTIVDYLEAERNWFDLQNQYFDAMYNYRKSLINVLVVSNLITKI